MKSNRNNYKTQPNVFRNKIKRIETLFSLLYYQFTMKFNYAKTFVEFKTRILSEITVLKIYVNKFIFGKDINTVVSFI